MNENSAASAGCRVVSLRDPLAALFIDGPAINYSPSTVGAQFEVSCVEW